MANQPLDLPKATDAAPASAPKAKKPLLDVDDLRKFDPDYWEEKADDPSWIEGYSQIVQANDIERADDLNFQIARRDMGSRVKTKEDAYRLIGAAPQRLKYNLMWLPVARANGGNLDAGSAKLLREYTERRGYRPVMGEKRPDGRITARILDEMGWSVPIDCHLEADGTIRRGVGDIALYYTDGDVARKWERWAAQQAAEADKPRLPDLLRDGGHEAETFMEEERGQGTFRD